MSNFFYLTLFLAVVMASGALYAAYLIYLNRKQRILNNAIANELGDVMSQAQKIIEKERKKYNLPQVGERDLADPAILSTLVTVLVYKLGDVRLNVLDFANIPNEEYVSVYVDTVTNDIVLSLNHNMAIDESSTAVLSAAVATDDDIYH
jgi:hypothetical protein